MYVKQAACLCGQSRFSTSPLRAGTRTSSWRTKPERTAALQLTHPEQEAGRTGP